MEEHYMGTETTSNKHKTATGRPKLGYHRLDCGTRHGRARPNAAVEPAVVKLTLRSLV